MRKERVWARLLGLERAVVESIEIDDEGQVVVAVRPHHRERDRCGLCRRRCPGFDLGEGRRRWRALDLGTTIAHLEADAPRVKCSEHGVVVCAVPWARHGSRFTLAFEQQVAWLAVNTSGSAVAELMRIAWRSVGAICERVAAEAGREADLLAGLERIGIDEISHRKGHRYLTVVVDHDTGRLVWAAPGRDKATVEAFFDALGEKRAKRLKLVSCDMAGWIEAVLVDRCPKAKRCVDPFHVIALATEALDKVRREVWREARSQGQGDVARELKGSRFALWKNPENLTLRQQAKLSDIERLNRPLYRAYLLKEQLRQIYRLGPRAAIRLLDDWLQWARRCRLKPFVKLARTITDQREGIVAAIRHGLSNARVEAINTQIRLIARRAFGFHSPGALISLAMLKLGGLCPPLPGRVTVTSPTETSGEPKKGGSTFGIHASVVQRAMFDLADQSASAAKPIRPIWGATFPARPPVWVRAMRDLVDQADDRGPIGSGSTLLSGQQSRCKKPSRRTGTMRCEKAEKERPHGEIVAEAIEPAIGAGLLSPERSLSSSLAASLICNLRLYLSSPSQSLNLRSSSIRLCGAENDLRTWPPRGRVSVYLRSREGACRTPAGRLFGPIGRLFRPGGHGLFGVALAVAGSCVRQACWRKGRERLAGSRGSSGLRPALRLWLRPSLHLRLHRPITSKARNRRSQRALRAGRFADISTQPPHRNIKRDRGNLIEPEISFLAPLALGAIAIASALAPRRFTGSTAPIALGASAIASALATHRLLASALASQRSGRRRPRAWRLA